MEHLRFGSSQCEENPKTPVKCQQSSLYIPKPLFCFVSQVNQNVPQLQSVSCNCMFCQF